jgi:hypothetical protein
MSHRRTVASKLEEASVAPSGLKASIKIDLLCPLSAESSVTWSALAAVMTSNSERATVAGGGEVDVAVGGIGVSAGNRVGSDVGVVVRHAASTRITIRYAPASLARPIIAAPPLINGPVWVRYTRDID